MSSQSPLTKRSFSNGPAIASDFADPGFIDVDATYYAFATNTGGRNIPIATSPDFNIWTVTGQDALPSVPSWSVGQIWAPDVIRLDDGTFVMYFAAAHKEDTFKHCVGTATSFTVQGPFIPSDTPLACPRAQGGAIDPGAFRDNDGSLYVVYKIDGNSLGGGGMCGNEDGSHSTPIMLQKLHRDGVTADGEATQVLDRGAFGGPLIEAPSLIVNSGTYFLFFSSNCYNGPYYDTSYATANSIGGPYTKSTTPLLVTGDNNGALNSPGGAAAAPDGKSIIFHADLEPSSPGIRQMWTAGISIHGTTVRIN